MRDDLLGYLLGSLEPDEVERVEAALRRARTTAPPSEDALRSLGTGPRANLCAQERGRIHLIPIADIVYLKAELKYVTARTQAREFLIEESLSSS